MCGVDVFSRRRFNALLISAGVAYALTPALRGEDTLLDISSTLPKQSPFLHPGMLIVA